MALLEVHDVPRVLSENRVIAVIGAHPDPTRAAHYVPAYLQAHGYEIYPVNATRVGEVLFGKPVVASLSDVPVAVDLVNVFRRSAAVAGHIDEVLSMTPLPKVVWLQLGIANDAAAEAWSAAGIDVIQDRCMLADHRALGLG